MTAPVLPTEVARARSPGVCRTIQSIGDLSLSHFGKDPATRPPAAPAGVRRTVLRGELTAHTAPSCYFEPRTLHAMHLC